MGSGSDCNGVAHDHDYGHGHDGHDHRRLADDHAEDDHADDDHASAADEYYLKCDGPAWWPNMEYLLQERSNAVGNFVSDCVKTKYS